MKKLTMILSAALISTMISVPAFAGMGRGMGNGTDNGMGKGMNGQQDNSRPAQRPPLDLSSGVPVTISGTVSEFGLRDGLKLDTGDGEVTVYGIGPVWYWEQIGATPPTAGDVMTVNGIEITLSNGDTRIITLDVTVNDQIVQLRDTETGAPLWRGERPVGERPVFSEGESVTISGSVATAVVYGGGLQVDTGSEVVNVYGLGPVQYWEDLGVAYPTVGDAIAVDGVNLVLGDDTLRFVPVSVTIGDTVVNLRDPETGAPLWRPEGFGGPGQGRPGQGGRGGSPEDCSGDCPQQLPQDDI